MALGANDLCSRTLRIRFTVAKPLLFLVWHESAGFGRAARSGYACARAYGSAEGAILLSSCR
jgi:hypothetical protein